MSLLISEKGTSPEKAAGRDGAHTRNASQDCVTLLRADWEQDMFYSDKTEDAQIRWRENPGVWIQNSAQTLVCGDKSVSSTQRHAERSSHQRGTGFPLWYNRWRAAGHRSKSRWTHAKLILFPILVFLFLLF